MNETQFTYKNGDLITYTGAKPKIVAICALIIALDAERPGFLDWILRQCALVDGNFAMTSTAQLQEASMEAQQATKEWLEEFEAAAENLTTTDLQWEVE